jgi:NitT/TauT family transport system ATP-binding protein
MITVDNIAHQYGSLSAVGGLSFTVQEGEFVSLVGPSGCGKTTLLKIVGGLISPTSGRVLIRGESPERARSGGKIGFVFQRPVLLPWRTATENVELPLEIMDGYVSPDRSAQQILADVGLAGFADALPRQLSGGMEQRVALARALIIRPEVLLMDEPFSALDEILRERLDSEILRLTEALQRTVLFVTHSVAEAVLLSDRIVVLSERPARIKAVLSIALERPRRPGHRSDYHLRLIEEIRQLLIS